MTTKTMIYHTYEYAYFLSHDVEGDGNCGYYTLLLGLENIGNRSYRPVVRHNNVHIPIDQNKPWQFSVVRLRRELQQFSEQLLANIYKKGKRKQGWFFYAGCPPGDDEVIENLSLSFYTNRLKQHHYFDGTLGKKAFKEYHMNPYWAAHVFAYKFEARVIIYTLSYSWSRELKTVTHSWSTTMTARNLPLKKRIQQVPHLHRISDSDFKEFPTVEMLFVTGYAEGGVEVDNHVQFVRRVICENIAMPPDPSPDSLRDCLLRGGPR